MFASKRMPFADTSAKSLFDGGFVGQVFFFVTVVERKRSVDFGAQAILELSLDSETKKNQTNLFNTFAQKSLRELTHRCCFDGFYEQILAFDA